MASLAATSLLFVLCVGFLHPRYAINDDLKIIAIAAGYPAATPAPFLVHINVLLGFLLVPLYGLHSIINWEAWLFLALDFASIWALLFVLLKSSASARWKSVGLAVILVCGSYFPLNITFTNAAALADLAGLSLLLASVQAGVSIRKAPTLAGLGLVVAGSMIRMQMLAITVPLVLVGFIFLHNSINLRALAIGLAATGLVILAAYGADRIIVRAHPDWNSYYHYNALGEQIRDAHRLENAGRTIRRISWSGNDQELFARLFYPDAGIYSVKRLQYLVSNIQGASAKPLASPAVFYQRLQDAGALPVLGVLAGMLLLSITGITSRRKAVAVTGMSLVMLAENIGLVWAYKDPDYVLLASLAGAAMMATVILNWPSRERAAATSKPSGWLRPGFLFPVVMIGLGLGILTAQWLEASRLNLELQGDYRRILTDLNRLQSEGTLAQDAIIVSPAHGIPWEWSNPLIVDFPKIPFFDTGWITFSPPYEQTLQHYQIDPLPQALYQKDNVYLMTKTVFQRFLQLYYEEHEHVTVTFEPVYNMPNPQHVPEFGDIQLYKVVRVK